MFSTRQFPIPFHSSTQFNQLTDPRFVSRRIRVFETLSSVSDMASPLTPDFCKAVYESVDSPAIDGPVLQILNVKRINATTASSTERYRSV